MKILMPYVDISGGKITDPKVGGGTEAFSRSIYQNFDVEVVDVPWHTTPQENKVIVNKIRTIAMEKKCDLILSNNIKSPCLYGIKDIGLPIMHITHTNYGLLTANATLAKMHNLGHSVFGVSQYNIDYTNNKSKRLGTDEVEFSGIVRPAYAKHDMSVADHTDTIVSVGRSNTYKAPFIIHKLFKKSKYKPVVITSVGVDEDSIDYYNRNKHLDHLLSIPHSEVLDHISRGVATCITCTKETYGIVALESLSLGVPVIIKCDLNLKHASSEIGKEDHFAMFYKDDPIPLVDKLAKIDRKEIKEYTHEKHSREKWVRDFSNAFDMTIEKYKKKIGSTSLDFFT